MLGGQRIGPFEIEKELGSGAMGTVYRAKFHRGEDKVVIVALKVVALGLAGNESAMARFEREASILKQLRHPHIVRLIAHGKINKQNPYIAMEYIDGEALDRVLARRGKLSWEEVLTYGRQLCEALQYAHDKGIIHRDLKPSNLMIAKDGTLKLTDFGIAKDTDVTALTGANSTIGTAAYMSPEQCKGDRNLSNKSDLYSLGIVFFELLSGRKPFTADTTVDMFLKHVNEKPPRIGKLVQDLPPKFEALILQLLEKDKEDRPIDAAWVGRMLQEVEDDFIARKSAGLAVAEARTLKPTNQAGDRMDEADKEAARALRGKKKKKKKTEEVPFLERKWVKAAGILLVLGGIVLGSYLMIRPASPEKLFAAIEKADTDEAKLAAATKFLEAHGDKGGEMVEKAALVFRELTVKEREKVLANRYEKNMTGPPDNEDAGAYSSAWDALASEKAGDLDAARRHWLAVKGKFPEEAKKPFVTDPEVLRKARWGWLADKRLADIAEADAELKRIIKRLNDRKVFEGAPLPDPGSPEGLAVRAWRFKDIRDGERGGQVCDTLASLGERDPTNRRWYLLAGSIRGQLPKVPADPSAERRERLNNRLKQADDLLSQLVAGATPEKERELRNLCREVIELYEGDRDQAAQDAVDRAKDILKKVPKR